MEVKIHAQPIDSKEEKKEYGKFDKWEVEGWARSLMEAEKIKQDPEKLKYAKMCLQKDKDAMNAISSIADLRKKKKEIDEEDKKEGGEY